MGQKKLSEKELDYYSRQIVLAGMGYNVQVKLKDAKACLVGLGGLGSPTAMQLAASGVGYLRLVDRDVVELSNLQRQHLYGVSDLGYPKVEVATKRLQDLNPYVEIEPLPLSLNQDNAEDIVKGMDVVVDGLDRMTPRYAVNRACVKLGIPYVFGAAITTIGNVSTIVPGKTPCLECFYGNLADEELPKCAVVGVHPSLLSVLAGVEASEGIRILAGKKPRLANKLLYCDIGNVEFNEIDISKVENCGVCGSKPSRSPMPLRRELIEEICGRGGKKVFVIVPKKNLEIPLTDLSNYLKKRGFNIKVKANLGITSEQDHKVTMSILRSGIMIVEGVKEKEDALNLFRDIISERLAIPESFMK